MTQTNLPEELAVEIRRRVFDEKGWMKITQVVRRGGETFRISLRPVMIKDEKRFQGEMVEDGKTTVKNFDDAGARKGLEEIIDQAGTRELHLITSSGDLHVRVTKKGKVLVSRSGAMSRDVQDVPSHDRVKQHPLNAFESTTLLKAIQIADADGRIKASMRGKYDQVNEFLRVIDTIVPSFPEKKINIVDCGCGKAYLRHATSMWPTT